MTYQSRQAKIPKEQKEIFKQDRYGYVSPYLESLRSNENRTRQQDNQLRNIEERRESRYRDLQVDIPDLTQPSGQPQLARRNNNPGNLRFRNQIDSSEGDKGFAAFPTPELGFIALERRLRASQVGGETVEQFLHTYAPAHDNNKTEDYIKRLTSRFGVQRNTPINQIDLRQLAQFVAHQESNTRVFDESPR